MVEVLSAPPWTMSVPLSRKRSRLATDEDDEQESRREPSPSPILSPASDFLKRSKTQCELDELDIVSPEDAWTVDIDALLQSNRISRSRADLAAHDNWANFKQGESIIVLCVQGNVQTHYDLLCSVLPELYSVSSSLQAFILCHEPPTHNPSVKATFSLPLIQAYEPPNNHFVRLGLLHPLGGGKFPLDAIAVLDQRGRRRLVLPFGWGAGKHASTPAGRSIQTRLMGLLKTCVERLEQER